MPLFDHFHPPISDRIGWTAIHSGWATRIADRLNEKWLPDRYVASETAFTPGHPEIDIATWEGPEISPPRLAGNGTAVALAPAKAFTVPEVDGTFAVVDSVDFSVQIHDVSQQRTLVGVIELISPSNKDRPSERLAFAAKIASFIRSGVCVVVIDPVTRMHFNLHNEVLNLMEAPHELEDAAKSHLYAASYRPKTVPDSRSVDFWFRPLAVGDALPTMPMRLTGDTFVPIEFEPTYIETCRLRRVT